jgi:hypothetical protein
MHSTKRMKITFNPFSIEESLRGIAMTLDFPPLNTFQVERLVDILVEEQVFHDEQIGFRLRGSCFEILDFDRVKAKNFAQYSRFARRRIHISEVRRGKIHQHLPMYTKFCVRPSSRPKKCTHKSATFQALTSVLIINRSSLVFQKFDLLFPPSAIQFVLFAKLFMNTSWIPHRFRSISNCFA